MKPSKWQVLATIEKHLSMPLPTEYKVFLVTKCEQAAVRVNGKPWKFATPERLGEMIQIGKIRKPYLEQVQCYLALKGCDPQESINLDEKSPALTVAQLAQGITIADENGDLLLLLPEQQFSVWAFYHDGGYAELQADNFLAWIQNCELEHSFPSDNQSNSDELDGIIAEMGICHFIESILIPRGLVKKESFLEGQHGRVAIRTAELKLIQSLSEKVAKLAVLPAQETDRRGRLLREIRLLGAPSDGQ